MRKIYEIIIETEKETCVEKIYGVLDTLARVKEIKDCDNVYSIDVMDTTTGEILLTLGGDFYSSTQLIVEILEEE